MTTAERLTAALRPADAPDEPREGWHVTDIDTAGYASRKLHALHREVADIDAWQRRETERIQQVAAAERDRLQGSIDFFTSALAQYLYGLGLAGRKTKSLDLPGGRIMLRARQPSLEVDQEQLVAWALQNRPQLVVTKHTVPTPALRKSVELVDGGRVLDPETGEVLPFATWTEQGDSASFAPAGVSE